MNFRLITGALTGFLLLVLAGFAFIPREPALFGMGPVPGPLALFALLGLPLLAMLVLGSVVYRRATSRRAGHVLVFAGTACVTWLLALVLYH